MEQVVHFQLQTEAVSRSIMNETGERGYHYASNENSEDVLGPAKKPSQQQQKSNHE
jgi:hypothetical protein